MKIFQIALGVLAAIGGFVDMGDIVFNTQAGAQFGTTLLWATAFGAIGIMLYSEMCGRVAAVATRPVFDTVRDRLGYRVGLTTLVASQGINVATCAAELGGLALIIQLLTNLNYRALIVVAAILIGASIWFLPFEWIERIFGFGGLLLLVFTVTAIHLAPDWGGVASGLVPSLGAEPVLGAYFAIGLFSAAMMPYEVFLYSSGAVEDGWAPRGDLGLNKATAVVGYGLGAILSFSLVIMAAELFKPLGIQPDSLGTVALGAGSELGQIGLLLAIGGMLFAVSGAAIDTALSGAYNLAQFLGWEWGLYRRKRAARFTFAWMGFVTAAGLIVLSGIDPFLITELSVIFSAVAFPFTYLPVLLVARDRNYMGRYANGRLANALGWVYLAAIVLVSVIAIPLLVLTNVGQG